jgi:hypothetical protein
MRLVLALTAAKKSGRLLRRNIFFGAPSFISLKFAAGFVSLWRGPNEFVCHTAVAITAAY